MNACSDHTADRQSLAVGKVDFRKSGVRRHQLGLAILLVEVLDGEIVVHLGNDYLAMAGTQRPVYHQDIAVLYACALHGATTRAPHEGGQRVSDQELVEVMALDGKIVCRRRKTGGHKAVDKGKGYK